MVNKHFPDQLEKVTGKEKAFNDTKNAGDIALKVGFKQKDKETKQIIEKDRWQSYTLAFMLQNPDKGMQEELYKSMVVAKDLKLIDGEDSRWDEPIGKAEAIQLIMNTHLAKNKLYGYLSEVEYGKINIDKFKIHSNIEGVDFNKVLGEDENGYKYGENWTEINPYQVEYNLDDEVGNGLTVRDLKIMVDQELEYCKENKLTEEDTKALLEAIVEGYTIPLDVLLEMPPVKEEQAAQQPPAPTEKEKPSEKKPTKPANKPADKPKDKPTQKPKDKPSQPPKQQPKDKPKEKPKSDGYSRQVGVPGTFPKTDWDKNGNGIEDIDEEFTNTQPVEAGEKVTDKQFGD